jgi:hypothetical protein
MICHEIVEKVKNILHQGRLQLPVAEDIMLPIFAFRHPGYVSHMFSMSGALI